MSHFIPRLKPVGFHAPVLFCKKDYPVYVDELIELYDVVSISAGMRGLQILLHPRDYLRAVKGVVGMISQDKTNP